MTDNDTNIKLSRRKILAGLGTIGLASAGAGAGTMALFSDTEDARATVQAGTLDLKVNGENGVVTVLNEENIAPGDSGSVDIEVHNAGSIDGSVSVSLESVTDYENGRIEPERDAGDDDDDGELSEFLKISIEYNGNTYGPTTVDNLNNYLGKYGDLSLPAGETKSATIHWELPEDGTHINVVQTDSVTVDFSVTLTQSN